MENICYIDSETEKSIDIAINSPVSTINTGFSFFIYRMVNNVASRAKVKPIILP